MARREDDIGDWLEDGATGGGLTLAGWGLGAAATLVLAFASWQYAPEPSLVDMARLERAAPDPSEITGSIGVDERTATQASRVVGGGRVAPMPLDGNETLATSRDIERLRGEIRDIQRRLTQMGMSGEGMARRVDRIDERLSVMAAAADAKPHGAIAEAPRAAEPAMRAGAPEAVKPTEMVVAERVPIERLPMPQPRPIVEIPPAPPIGNDGDGPATTGAVPKPAAGPMAQLAEIQGTRPAKPDAARSEPIKAEAVARVETTLPARPETPKSEPVAKPAPIVKAEPVAKPEPVAKAEPVARVETAPKPESGRSEAAPKGSRGPIATGAPQATAPQATAPTEAPSPMAVAPGLAGVAAMKPAPVVEPTTTSAIPPRLASATPPASASVAAGGGAAGIDLGGYRTLASLRRSWADMTIRYGDLANGLEPLARLRETDSGMEARLLAGPFADPTEAAKACLKLKAAGANCTVTTYGGQPVGGLH